MQINKKNQIDLVSCCTKTIVKHTTKLDFVNSTRGLIVFFFFILILIF